MKINVVLYDGGIAISRWEDVKEIDINDRVIFFHDGKRYIINGTYIIERIIEN